MGLGSLEASQKTPPNHRKRSRLPFTALKDSMKVTCDIDHIRETTWPTSPTFTVSATVENKVSNLLQCSDALQRAVPQDSHSPKDIILAVEGRRLHDWESSQAEVLWDALARLPQEHLRYIYATNRTPYWVDSRHYGAQTTHSISWRGEGIGK